MEHDKSIRSIIDSARTKQLSLDDVLEFARKNTLDTKIDELKLK